MDEHPLRGRHGLVPELADYMRGLQVLAQLRQTGMDLVPDRATTTALGRAQREAEPGPDPAHDPAVLAALAQVQARNVATLAELDQIQAQERRRREMEQELDLDHRPPDISKGNTSEVREGSGSAPSGAGRTDPASAEQVGESAPFDPITEFLKNDPDDQWSEP